MSQFSTTTTAAPAPATTITTTTTTTTATTKEDAQPCHSDVPSVPSGPSGDSSDLEKAVLARSSASPVAPALEKWNQPGVNRNRYFATVFGLTVMGLNDACLGALIPYVRSRLSCPVSVYWASRYLWQETSCIGSVFANPAHQIETYYSIGYTVVSLLFLTSFVGYMAAALSSNLIHHHFGQRGVAIIAPLSRLLGYVVMALHPPYPVLPVALLFPGFGNGLEDSAWNVFVGDLQHANQLLGIMHGAYGAGATIAPLIATTMVTRSNPALEWYAYYYIMIGLSALETCLTTTAFWRADAVSYRHKHASGSTTEARTTTRTVLREPITWLVALFLLGYVGAEVSLGGWITTFSKYYYLLRSSNIHGKR